MDKIVLTEYVPVYLPAENLSMEQGETLWQQYSTQIQVEFPSPKTKGQWQLTAQGWVGRIPFPDAPPIVLQPKVPLSNLFRMLEYAYHLRSFRFLEGLIESATLEELYERLARVLSKRTMDRVRKGLYRTYLPQADELPYVRGRLNIPHQLRTPWKTRMHCDYEEHTADIEDNQLLAWTLSHILRTGICSPPTSTIVRRAFRALQGTISALPFGPDACVGRLYNRLNEDYATLHALCRFFLEHTGPSHKEGEHPMLPFLVNMARLYELFLAEWLKQHLPEQWQLRVQERVSITSDHHLFFTVDLVILDLHTGKVRSVLDTKYKAPSTPATADIAQVIAYAESQGCHEAILVYPQPLSAPLDTYVGDVRVRTIAFPLDGDLEANGQAFLQAL